MSMYYSPEIVKLTMDERLGAAREANRGYCCTDDKVEDTAERPSVLSRVFGRMFGVRTSAAPCSC